MVRDEPHVVGIMREAMRSSTGSPDLSPICPQMRGPLGGRHQMPQQRVALPQHTQNRTSHLSRCLRVFTTIAGTPPVSQPRTEMS